MSRRNRKVSGIGNPPQLFDNRFAWLVSRLGKSGIISFLMAVLLRSATIGTLNLAHYVGNFPLTFHTRRHKMSITLGMRDKSKTREHVVALINSLPDNFAAYTAATNAAANEQNALVKKINEKAAQGFLSTYNESREEISTRLAEVLLKLSEDSKKFLEVIKPLLPYIPTEQDVKAKKIRES